MQELERVQRLDDGALIERLTHSVRGDRKLSVRMLIEMGEVQARGLHRDLGFTTMFEYATKKLGMSESEAALRMRVAKLGRACPVALELLERCEVNLSTLAMLAPVLTADNLELLYEARHKTKEQVFQLLARRAPKPDVPDRVRKLPSTRPSARAPRAKPPAVVPLAPTPSQPAAAEPARETFRHKITFSAGQHVRDLLDEAQNLLRARHPDGDLESIFEQALELLVAREKKRQFGQTDKPRTEPQARPKHSRYIPRHVRREVYARDAGQCCFVGPDGRRCSARGRLEYDHSLKPYGRGGLTSAANLRLLCAAHNALLAEREYGPAFMRACIRSEQITKQRSTTDRRPPNQT
jgi:5-methylcytosine-specific restriction endonuclease McrA